jgi:hypothetical protein
MYLMVKKISGVILEHTNTCKCRKFSYFFITSYRQDLGINWKNIKPDKASYMIHATLILHFLQAFIAWYFGMWRNLKNIYFILNGSGDGVQQSESLGLWTFSIVRYSKNQKAQRFGNRIWFRRNESNLSHCTAHVTLTTGIKTPETRLS